MTGDDFYLQGTFVHITTHFCGCR